MKTNAHHLHVPQEHSYLKSGSLRRSKGRRTEDFDLNNDTLSFLLLVGRGRQQIAQTFFRSQHEGELESGIRLCVVLQLVPVQTSYINDWHALRHVMRYVE